MIFNFVGILINFMCLFILDVSLFLSFNKYVCFLSFKSLYLKHVKYRKIKIKLHHSTLAIPKVYSLVKTK